MILRPVQLGHASLRKEELDEDKKHCKRFGPCGVGRKALYLNSFYIDCRYYVPYASVTRVFKRVAMSKGGFSQKGIFASIPYLVVVYDDGREKQCNFKYEEQVDQLLACVAQEHPEIKQLSAAAEKRLAEQERALAAQKRPPLSPRAQEQVQSLQNALEYLEKKPELTLELSQSARRKRAYLCSKPSYRWVALAITLMGLVSLIYGIYLLTQHGGFAVYFLLFGLAAIFMFSGASVLPTARNNKAAIMDRARRAQEAVEGYISFYHDFPLPARYAHPIVLKRMQRAIEDGRASSPAEALEIVKQDLKALNADVEVDQAEYDEVIAIKALFLNEDYK